MPANRGHPSAASRSRAPTGKPGKPPAAGSPPEDQVKGPREIIEQAARDIKAGIVDDDRRRIPDDVPGPRADPEKTAGAQVKPEGVNKRSK